MYWAIYFRVFRDGNGREFYLWRRGAVLGLLRFEHAGFVWGEEPLSTAASSVPADSVLAKSVLVVAGERLARYGFPDGHPFGPDRHAAFYAEFSARGLDKRVRIMETRAASRAEL